MKPALLRILISGMLFALAAPGLLAYSIVDVPTANQAALHEVNLAYYSLSIKKSLPPTHKDIYVAYSTVAPGLELKYIHVDINNGFGTQDLVNASYKLMPETAKTPDVVIGVKNIFEDDTSPSPDEQKRSFYIATAKTLNPPSPDEPWHPVVRLHVNYGTKEHRGLFGGVQIAITPRLGFAAMKITNSPYSKIFLGNEYEFALVYSLGKKGPNIKAGTLGHSTWAGLDYSLHY